MYNSFSFRRPFGYLFLSLLLFCGAGGYAQRWVNDHAAAVITPYMLQQTISYLASDSMKGRETPGPGLDSAGTYIARQFESYGVKPINGSYFQDLQFCYFDLGSDIFLSIVKDLQTLNFEIDKDFSPYEFSGAKPAEGDLVFAGYGISAPEYNYDDYKEIDVQGKVVVILRQEPGQSDSTQTLFKGKELTRYSSLELKQKTAMEHGAVGVLVISGPLNYTSLKPRAFPWPSLSGSLPGASFPLGYCGNVNGNIPMVSVGESIINELFGNADTLKHLQQHLEHDMQPHSFVIPGKTIAINITFTSKPVGGRNVIGILRGSDPVLKEEAIVVGAHYDHIGNLKEHRADSDFIFNGADDNASGTGGMLAVAKAMASMPEPPRRSVIFIAFAGEEKGLLGSETYVRKPLWPLKKTAAMLNLDMISRNFPDSLEIIGARQNPDLMKIIRKQNQKTGFMLKENQDVDIDQGSDHYSFFRRGITAVVFFTGLHQDYHKVSDGPEKVNAEKAARVSRLAFLTAWWLANDKHHYKIVESKGGEDD